MCAQPVVKVKERLRGRHTVLRVHSKGTYGQASQEGLSEEAEYTTANPKHTDASA
jgi:hypothetical protein